MLLDILLTEIRGKFLFFDQVRVLGSNTFRCLKAMKIITGLGMGGTTIGDLYCEWFSFGIFLSGLSDLQRAVYIQDIIHILTKLRNRLLKISTMLPFGDKLVSSTHLKLLLLQVSKDNHLLTNTDIHPKDRMNAKSAEKICHPLVQECLKKYIPGSEATVVFLKVMNYATSSFLDSELLISERIKRIWYSVFVLRIWRSWLSSKVKENQKKSKKRNAEQKKEKISEKAKTSVKDSESADETLRRKYSLSENFISNNAYACIELNAHSLVKYIIQLRTNDQPHLFITKLLGSQSCESTFRQVRSLTSTYSTVVNFTMYDMLHRLKKIQMQSDIITDCPELNFPRVTTKQNKAQKIPTVFPSNEEIVFLISAAKEEAIVDTKQLGIDMKDIDFGCQVKPVSENKEQIDDDEDDEDDDEDDYDGEVGENEEYDKGHFWEGVDYLVNPETDTSAESTEIERDVRTLKSITGPLIMRDYAACNVDEDSPYCVVLDGTCKEHIVRKSSICWLLTQNKHSLSSDRLVRVRESDLIKQKKCMLTCS